MLYYAIKVAITAIVVVAISEIAKRHSAFAAVIASLPLTSLLAFIWLHVEGRPAGEIALLARDIFWMVLPSLALFALLPPLLRAGLGFWPSLGLAAAATVLCYAGTLAALAHLRGSA